MKSLIKTIDFHSFSQNNWNINSFNQISEKYQNLVSIALLYFSKFKKRYKTWRFFNDFMKMLIFHWFYHYRWETSAGFELRLLPPWRSENLVNRSIWTYTNHVLLLGSLMSGLSDWFAWMWVALMLVCIDDWFALMAVWNDVALHWCWFASMLGCIDVGLHWCWFALMIDVH